MFQKMLQGGSGGESEAVFLNGYLFKKTINLSKGKYICTSTSYSSAGTDKALYYTILNNISNGTFKQLFSQKSSSDYGYAMCVYEVVMESDGVLTYNDNTQISIVQVS